MRSYSIYGLYSTEFPEVIRYVGITYQLTKRLTTHITESKHKNKTHKQKWIRSVYSNGFEVKMIELDGGFSESDVVILEQQYIRDYKEKGFKLVNGTPGGETTSDSLKIPVVQLTKDFKFVKEWESDALASIYLGSTHTGKITKCCKGNATLAFGYTWSYKSDYEQGIYRNIQHSKNRTVCQLDLEGNLVREHYNESTAVSNTGIDRGSINNCLRKRNVTAGGFQWVHKDKWDGEPFTPKYKTTREVIQLTLNGEFIKEYKTIAEANLAITGSKRKGRSIAQACASGGSSYGFMWRYKEDYDPATIKPYKVSYARPVVQLTLDGQFIKRFDSGVDADRENGGCKGNVSTVCNGGKTKTAYGFKWVFEADYLKSQIL